MDRIELRLKYFSVPVSSSSAFIGITGFHIKTDWREKNMSEICMNRRNAKNSSLQRYYGGILPAKNWEVEAKSLPVSVNSTKKKENKMTTLIFIDITEIKTLHLFVFPAIKKNLSCTTALQKPEIYRNPRKDTLRPIRFQNPKSPTNILKHLCLL